LRNNQLCSHSRTSQHFMDPEGSIPCSQEHSIAPHPKLYQSNTIPFYLSSILISSTHLRLGLPSGLFPPGFPTNILYAFRFSPIRATCPAHLILLDVIILIIPKDSPYVLQTANKIYLGNFFKIIIRSGLYPGLCVLFHSALKTNI
jgi:hypothetical protein